MKAMQRMRAHRLSAKTGKGGVLENALLATLPVRPTPTSRPKPRALESTSTSGEAAVLVYQAKNTCFPGCQCAGMPGRFGLAKPDATLS